MASTTTPYRYSYQQDKGLFARLRRLLSNALIVTRREVRDSFRDWRIVAPILILTFLFPFLAQFVLSRFRGFLEQYGASVMQERTIPFMLMVVGFFPISISLVIALETFVGEKERLSLEPLLSTPLTNAELYIGKTLAAMLPPLISSFGGMMVYLASVLFGELAWRPEPVLIIQIMLLTTVQALVMVTGAVVVSSQVTSTRAANLLASFIVIPMALVIQGESVIMFIAPDTASSRGIGALWAIIAGMVIVCLLLLRVGSSIFNREELLSSTVDQLNLRGSLRKIWRYVRAVDAEGTPAKNLGDWYRRAIPFSLSRIKTAVLVSIAVFLLAFVIGVVVGNMPRWQLPLENHGEIVTSPDDFDNFISANFQSREAVLFIFSQNVRVLIGTTLLAMFTFGAFALIIPPLTFAVMGYLFTQVIAAGFNPWILAAAIIPHGIIEIPMVLLATAAALALGASVTSPVRSRQSGQGWLARLGDTIKLFFGIVIPGLVIAAVIEAFITPEILLRVLT